MEMMNIKVNIHDLGDEDCLEESSMQPLNLTVSPDSTFEDITRLIKEKEDYDIDEGQLLFGFYPVELTKCLKDMVEDGDTLTALVDTENSTEFFTVSNMCTDTETIYLIVGRREKFDVIPFMFRRGSIPRVLPTSFFQKYNSFGIVQDEQGPPGERIYTCYIYRVQDGATVELRGDVSEVQVFQNIGTLPVEFKFTRSKFTSKVSFSGAGRT
eukprot:TRINITY_DN12057_c0_g1_i3.p1 TRINITY_DN12057_c0_g1~~TRINITY_DN12057_c0_g1_i3.p1  ORF type:complete len:212 (-),score=44.38 TRINITY_DN12057_c0_g1_i3:72-707(-)